MNVEHKPSGLAIRYTPDSALPLLYSLMKANDGDAEKLAKEYKTLVEELEGSSEQQKLSPRLTQSLSPLPHPFSDT